MERCKTCKHWTQTSSFQYSDNYGKCSRLKRSDMFEAILQLGWDGGYVDYYETDEKFGCVLHEDV